MPPSSDYSYKASSAQDEVIRAVQSGRLTPRPAAGGGISIHWQTSWQSFGGARNTSTHVLAGFDTSDSSLFLSGWDQSGMPPDVGSPPALFSGTYTEVLTI